MVDKVANPHRGEVKIELGGKAYVMRPTFGAIAEIESRTGIGIADLAERAVRGRIKMTEMAAVVTSGLVAAGEPAVYEKVGQMIFDQGMLTVAAPVVEFLGQAVTGGQSPGEAPAAEAD